MSDNIRTALYDAHYDCRLVSRSAAADSPDGSADPVLSRVVGKHCESGDVVVRDCWLPADLAPGDLLAVAATGAYCYAMASSYNRLPRPAVVAVRDGAAPGDAAPRDARGPVPAGGVGVRAPPASDRTVRPAMIGGWEPEPHPHGGGFRIVDLEAEARRCGEWCSPNDPIRVALLGCGTVGGEVVRLLLSRPTSSPPGSAPRSSWSGWPCAGRTGTPTCRRAAHHRRRRARRARRRRRRRRGDRRHRARARRCCWTR